MLIRGGSPRAEPLRVGSVEVRSITGRRMRSRGSLMAGDARVKRHFRRVAIAAALLAGTACAIGLWFARSRGMNDPLSRAVRAYDGGHWANAAELSRNALNIRPDDPAALQLLARSSARLGRDDAAIAIYSRRLDEKSIEAEDYVLLGQAHGRRGQGAAASSAWNKVLEAGQVSPKALDELARLHVQGRRFEAAIPITERLSQHPGWEARGFMMLGTIRAKLDDIPAAAESFHRALAVDPAEVDKSHDPVPLRKLIARTFLRMSRPAEARPPLQSILDRGPDPEAAWLLSRVFLQEGDKAQAVASGAGPGRLLSRRQPDGSRAQPLCGRGELREVPPGDFPEFARQPA